MAVFNILYGNYYPPHGEFELICIGKFARRTWVDLIQQYGKNRRRCQQNKFNMLYGNYCFIFIENFPQKFCPCWMREKRLEEQNFRIGDVSNLKIKECSNLEFPNLRELLRSETNVEKSKLICVKGQIWEEAKLWVVWNIE